MENFTFYNSTEIIFGKGEVNRVGEKTADYGKKVLLVTGGGSVKRIGLYDRVMNAFENADLEVFELTGIEPNPRISKVREGVDICLEKEIDIVIAVGGGSVIDTAKAVAAGVCFDGDPWEMFTMEGEPDEAIPVGVVLTLAATGSEMNGNAVISNLETEQKLAIHTPACLPVFSILDPVNTYTVPKEHTVYGIIDIAAHVFEQYFSHTESTPIQDSWAEGIIKTLIKESEVVLENPEDYNSRANIMLAGTMAINGLLSIGKDDDWASHAIEHELSAIYDIPHGGGLAILFPNWMKYVLSEGTDKFVQYAVNVFNIDTKGKSDQEIALAGIEKTREWFNSMGAPARLADYDIGEDKLEEMAAKAVSRGPLGSYKVLEKEDVLEIYRMSL
ncbi:iron-containing alcohol dehydrogenase [Halocella sp. SP3-1]|uniref:iron-containing alcohol dehydrogenase n=1 Tax=Halocella sp. SP3-1 TaxID=2382161 RepID=UPI000F75E463|nr:iron-containing alcohol dehydrogenase [Halocella sp. SP3-1]AZO96625.1 iron-containing alcohol dehydrogenase [Halocella sp. SP3-1]